MGASTSTSSHGYSREANAFTSWHCGRKDWAPFVDRCYPPEIANKMKAVQIGGAEVVGYTVVWGNDFVSFGPVLSKGGSFGPCCSHREGSARATALSGGWQPMIDVVFELGRSPSTPRRHKLLDMGVQKGLCPVSLVAVITDMRRSTVRLCFYAVGGGVGLCSATSTTRSWGKDSSQSRGGDSVRDVDIGRRSGRLGSLLVPVLSGSSRNSDVAVSLEAHALRRRFLEQWRPAAVVRRELLPERQPSTGAWGASLPHDHVSLNLQHITEADWALLTSTWPAWDATLIVATGGLRQAAEDPRVDLSSPPTASAQQLLTDHPEEDGLHCCSLPRKGHEGTTPPVLSRTGPLGAPSPRLDSHSARSPAN